MKKIDLSKTTTYQAGVTQAHMHRNLQKICDSILSPYGITKMQWLIIGTVLDAQPKGIRVSELAEMLGTTMSYLTTSINLLEARQILIRKEHLTDTRSRQVLVNEQFVPQCAEIEKTLRDGLRDSIYANVDPKEFTTYIKVMNQLAAVRLKDS